MNLKRITLTLVLFTQIVATIIGQDLINENFSSPNTDWQAVSVSGSGNFSFSGGKLTVNANSNSTYGVYNTQTLSGHFYIEVEFEADDNVALALFNANGGSPDIANYSLIKVESNGGTPVVSISDKQNGSSDVLDNTGKTDKNKRYSNTLNASTFSVPYTSTNKKLRIFRHEDEGFIHFYYAVKKTIKGQEAEGWMELAPSKEWSQLSGNFYLGLVAIDGSATFDNATASSKPKADKDDSNTGFAATWREMNWNGYFGDALVVTFDKNDAPLTGGTRKYVFWSELNNIPAWYLDEDLLYTYEFVETWDGGNEGCHEPMSDRILRFSNVDLVYDGNDYKEVHWQYVLINPDYKTPDDNLGSEYPIVDEYYRIYPDGVILRKIRYKPKLDSDFRNWHELSELIVISGRNTLPNQHLSNPSLTIWPVSGSAQTFHPTGSGNDYETSHNDATITGVHFTNHPDVVNVFNDNNSNPETYAGYSINYKKTWHDINYEMSHWPVNKELYSHDYFKSVMDWEEQVKHVSLCGIAVYGGTNWTDNYQTDTDGREYREWISFQSLSTKGNLAETETKVTQWLTDTWNWSGSGNPGTSYTITASAGVNGSISPSGSVNVAEGSNQTFTITANSGYSILDVTVDGVSQGAISSYTFTNVTANHTINASFEEEAGNSFAIPGVIQAEDYTDMYGVQTENTSDAGGGQNVGWINSGDWMEYEVNVSSSGDYTVDFRVAAQSSNILFNLESNGTTLTNVNSSSTGGWQNWKTVSKTITLTAGVQTIRLYASGGGWNINWISFSEAQEVFSNIALNKSTTTSSDRDGNTGSNAVDGNEYSRWESDFSDPQWISIDLGAQYNMNAVTIIWEAAYSSEYKIEVSDVQTNWTQVYYTSSGNGGTDNINFSLIAGRYIRLYGMSRGTGWGHSVYEIEVYGGLKSAVNESLTNIEESDRNNLNTITVTPNPVNSEINLLFEKEITGTINILNYNGQLVYSQNVFNTSKAEINVSGLHRGLYIINIPGTDFRSQVFIKL